MSEQKFETAESIGPEIVGAAGHTLIVFGENAFPHLVETVELTLCKKAEVIKHGLTNIKENLPHNHPIRTKLESIGIDALIGLINLVETELSCPVPTEQAPEQPATT